MRRTFSPVLLIILTSLAAAVLAASLFAEETIDERAERIWYNKMNEAWGARCTSELGRALTLYEEAMALVPSREHEADTLYHIGWASESLQREEAIIAYKRLVAEYSESGLTPIVLRRLAAIHLSVLLIPGDSPEERYKEVMAQMGPEKALPFLEAAVAFDTEPPWHIAVLKCRLELATLLHAYPELERVDEALALVHSVAQITDIDELDSVSSSPFSRIRNSRLGDYEASRQDTLRENLAELRGYAGGMLVQWSLVPCDTVASMQNIEALIQRYPDSVIAAKAEAKLAELSAQPFDEEVTEGLHDIHEAH